MHDWYRNTTWDKNIETAFEARLNRSRGTHSKSQYLRIQASYLLQSSDKITQSIGVGLMDRLIADYPTEKFSVLLGQEQLGDYFFKIGDFNKAEKYFLLVTEHCQAKNSRSGTSGIADLKLAETILIASCTDRFEKAYAICKEYPLKELVFNNQRYYYAQLLARLCNKMKRKEEAKVYAGMALEISKITEPQFKRHKTVGLVMATNEELLSLEQILND